MKRNWKRILALLLTAAMVFTMNTSVFANPADGGDTPAEVPADVAEATTPETTTPEATTPEATTPEATTPEATTPEATTPETTNPETTNPENKPEVTTTTETVYYTVKDGVNTYYSDKEGKTLLAVEGQEAGTQAAFDAFKAAKEAESTDTVKVEVKAEEITLAPETVITTIYKKYYKIVNEDGSEVKDESEDGFIGYFKKVGDGEEEEISKEDFEALEAKVSDTPDADGNQIVLGEDVLVEKTAEVDGGVYSDNFDGTGWSVAEFDLTPIPVEKYDGTQDNTKSYFIENGNGLEIHLGNGLGEALISVADPQTGYNKATVSGGDGSLAIKVSGNTAKKGTAYSIVLQGTGADVGNEGTDTLIAAKDGDAFTTTDTVLDGTVALGAGATVWFASNKDFEDNDKVTVSSSGLYADFSAAGNVLAVVSGDATHGTYNKETGLLQLYASNTFPVGGAVRTPVIARGTDDGERVNVTDLELGTIVTFVPPEADNPVITKKYGTDGSVTFTVEGGSDTWTAGKKVYNVVLSENTAYGSGLKYEDAFANGHTGFTDSNGEITMTLKEGESYQGVVRTVSGNIKDGAIVFAKGTDAIYAPSDFYEFDTADGPIDEKALKDKFVAQYKNVGLHTASVNLTWSEAPAGYTVSAVAAVLAGSDAPTGDYSPSLSVDWTAADGGNIKQTEMVYDGTEFFRVSSNILTSNPGTAYDFYAKVIKTAGIGTDDRYVWVKVKNDLTTVHHYEINDDYKLNRKQAAEIPYYGIKAIETYFKEEPKLVVVLGNRRGGAGEEYKYNGTDWGPVPGEGLSEEFFLADHGVQWNILSENSALITSLTLGGGGTTTAYADINNKYFIDKTVNATVSWNYETRTGLIPESKYEDVSTITTSIPLKVVPSPVTISAANCSLENSYTLHSGDLKYKYYAPETNLDAVGGEHAPESIQDKYLNLVQIGGVDASLTQTYAPGGYDITLKAGIEDTISMNSEYLGKVYKDPGYKLVIGTDAAKLSVLPSLKDELAVTITPGSIQYGEKGGSNTGTNVPNTDNVDSLNELFAPAVTASGNDLEVGEDVTIEYRFSDKPIDEANISNNKLPDGDEYGNCTTSWNGLKKLLNKDFKAGDTVYVVAKVTSKSSGAKKRTAYAISSFTMDKRDVKLAFDTLTVAETKNKENAKYNTAGAIPGFRRNGTDTNVSINEAGNKNTVEMTALSSDGVKDAPGFDGTLAVTTGILSANEALVLDDSRVNPAKAGLYATVFKSYVLSSSFDKNFNVLTTTAKIQVYPYNEAVFTASYKGKVSDNSVPGNVFDITDDAKDAKQFGTAAKAAAMKALYDSKTFNGFIEKDDQSTYEVVGFNISRTDGDGATNYYNDDVGGWTTANNAASANAAVIAALDIDQNYDYMFEAVIEAKTSSRDVVRVKTAGNVTYDGRSHVIIGTDLQWNDKKRKSQAEDIALVLNGAEFVDDEGAVWELRDMDLGDDYTVSYKNNKNASVKYVNGQMTQLYEQKKQPTIIVKGKGSYKGMKLTLHFNILPRSLRNINAAVVNPYEGDVYTPDENVAVTGLAHGIVAGKNGKEVKLKYTASYKSAATHKTVKLKKNKDYKEVVYKYDETAEDWSLATPSGSGDYFLTLEGMGNYTDVYYPGERAVNWVNPSTGYFHLADKSELLDNAKVKYTKKAAWPGAGNDKYLKADDYITSVKLGKTELDKTKDIQVRALLADQKTAAGSDDHQTFAVEDGKLPGNYFGEDAGTYYLEVLPKADKNGKVKCYGSKKLKFTVTGKKISSMKKTFDIARVVGAKETSLAATKFKLDYTGNNDYLVVKSSLKPFDEAKNTGDYTVQDAWGYLGTSEALPGNNATPNKYSVTIQGQGQYGGSTLVLKFERKAMNFKDAVANPKILKISVNKVAANVNGSFPEIVIETGDGKTAEKVNVDYRETGKTELMDLVKKGKIEKVDYWVNGRPLVLDLKFSNNKKAGTGKVTFKGNTKEGSFVKGSYTMTFPIEQAEIKDATMDNKSYFDANGSYGESKFYVDAIDQVANTKGDYSKAVSKFKVYQSDQFGFFAKAIPASEVTVGTKKAVSANVLNEVQLTAGKKNTSYKFANNAKVDGKAGFYVYQSNKVKFIPFKSNATVSSLNYQLPNIGKDYAADTTKLVEKLDVAKNQATYTGGPIRPDLSKLTIKINGTDTAFTEYDDGTKKGEYAVSYGPNTAAGTGTITVKLLPTGNNVDKSGNMLYGGTYTYNFKIVGEKTEVAL